MDLAQFGILPISIKSATQVLYSTTDMTGALTANMMTVITPNDRAESETGVPKVLVYQPAQVRVDFWTSIRAINHAYAPLALSLIHSGCRILRMCTLDPIAKWRHR